MEINRYCYFSNIMSEMHLSELIFCVAVYSFSVVYGSPGALRDDLAVGYYWREYSRDVPHDALPGGTDARGKTTYIGQTVHRDCENQVILTGQIREAEQKMLYEWGYKSNVATSRIQILCTHHPEHFRWIQTTSTEIKTLSNVHLIAGGTEQNYKVYIGRISRDGQLAIGKVIVSNSFDFRGLYTVMNNSYLHEKETFEVLAYDPNIPQKEKPKTMKLSSSNSGTLNIIWQPILALTFLQTLYLSFT